MKKDVYVVICAENKDSLFEIQGFICGWQYPKEERFFL